MYQATPPATDLSRSRLKALTRWVRDELDLTVAREGPNSLHPDDVLTLHDTFVQLRLSTNITALDLRATGIHRAVQDIAGVATRWPGRLCDDCDKIIALWTAKFGPFSALHPFLYGRGGRLEGIASATEHSRDALLKRWSETCPEKLHPKRSHRLGDLGFRAGDWWINTLFAHHAGIIGLEAVEGGTTFDKHGAYALVLKDTGEVEANSEDRFTYRVPQNDKGKFRLTAATPRSRDPIRVLRSHSINSVWGPKAGVRFDGVYAVKGWSIRQAKTADAAGGEWKEGDIVFEVRFERKDPVPMEEVAKRPTATEVDDYSEYKRLRKIHREGKRNTHGIGHSPVKIEVQQTTKAAPPILPLTSAPARGALKSIPRAPPDPSCKSVFRHPHFDSPEEHSRDSSDVVSPMTVVAADQFPLPVSKSSTLAVPVRRTQHHDALPSAPSPGTTSIASSDYTGASARSDIREVAPWIDFDAGLTLPPPEDGQPTFRGEIISPSLKSSSTKKKKKPTASSTRPALQYQDSPPMSTRRDRRKSGDFKTMTGPFSLSSGSAKAKDSRKSIFVRSRNPMAKILDGAASTEETGDYFSNAVYEPSTSSPKTTPSSNNRKGLRMSSNPAMRVHSPIPIRPFSPESPFYRTRRGAIYAEEDEDALPAFPILSGVPLTSTASLFLMPQDNPFIEPPSSSAPVGIPMSLKKFISQPLPATLGTPTPYLLQDNMEVSKDLDAAQQLRKAMGGDGKDEESKITFRNPFSGMGSPMSRKKRQREKKKKKKKSIVEVAPDVAV